MTTLIEQANALHARLTTLGKVPEGITKHPIWMEGVGLTGVCAWKSEDKYGSVQNLRGSDALAILRDAARRECDFHNVRIDWESIIAGEIVSWAVCEGDLDWIAENCQSYEQALVEGLDWIIEQRGEDA